MEHINDEAEQVEKDRLVKKKRPREDPANTEFTILKEVPKKFRLKLFLILFTKELMSAAQQACGFVAPTKTIFKALALKMALQFSSSGPRDR
eukprot:m51a1_g13212 hypothetical protein (92) ;mRNA; r:1831-2539